MGSRLEANSSAVRKRIEKHKFDDEEGEEYGASKFGGFPEYFRRKKIKLQNLDAELRSTSTENPPIFRGVVAHVNGYTQPSLNDLHALIVSHGGGFLQYLDGKTTVTHIIASNLTPKKKVEFNKYRIVKPAWVVDSVKVGRLLPWNRYRVVDEGVGQQVLGFDNSSVVSQANCQQSGYRDQTDASWYTERVKDVAQQLNGARSCSLPSSQISFHTERVAGDEHELVSHEAQTDHAAHSKSPWSEESESAGKNLSRVTDVSDRKEQSNLHGNDGSVDEAAVVEPPLSARAHMRSENDTIQDEDDLSAPDLPADGTEETTKDDPALASEHPAAAPLDEFAFQSREHSEMSANRQWSTRVFSSSTTKSHVYIICRLGRLSSNHSCKL